MLQHSPLESTVERYLIRRVKELGGKALKFVSPGTAGVADRLVLLPHGVAFFVEVKRLGEFPAPLQTKFAKDCTEMGHYAFWVDTQEGVDKLLSGMKDRMDAKAAAEVEQNA